MLSSWLMVLKGGDHGGHKCQSQNGRDPEIPFCRPGSSGPGTVWAGSTSCRAVAGWPGEQRDPVARPWACGAGASRHPAQQTSTTGVRPGASVPNTRRSQGSTTTSPEEASGGTNVSGGTECAPSGPAGPVTPSLGRSGCARAPPRAGRGAGVLSLPRLSRRCGHGAGAKC